MTLVTTARAPALPLSRACHALDLNRSSVYARQQPRREDACSMARARAPQPRSLTPTERRRVLTLLHSEAFHDQPPAQVYQHLLEQDRYLCSVSTMHRLLRAAGENGERRLQRPAQHHAVPRLSAQAPHDVWTWDITKLATATRGTYLSLYVVLDLYIRYVVAWMVSRKENSALARQLIDQAATRYDIEAGRLTLHQDRGSPMIAHSFLDLMSDLGVTPSHSRPRVSNDNPFSESQFKTQKQQPDYPQRFAGVAHAKRWCADYFDWYNRDHHHAGLAGFTPEQVFTGRHHEIAADKQAALDRAYQATPKRFVRGRPHVPMPPDTVTINPVTPAEIDNGATQDVNFPTLSRAKQINKLSLN